LNRDLLEKLTGS